ncbi:Fis family transcriptional regulator [Candidatus Methylomirabilis lanthanidiphila]|uniref:Fis family transcriptional regulator n=1 Tax=Candidatus Methylomirabilis lanthanidiphila TaxID=2211376 RepID=A0A564ZMH3_9BACT|nr:response regulator [Candidatus Methylomirabilis lanthanidiphila]VUZ85852.1 Fis family transcriptional regulator [Candidatus Methylomirabilis lanthanidiphila]
MSDFLESRASAAGELGSGETSGPAVVLIEDERPIRRFLRATLVSQGYRLFEAATGEEGLAEAAVRQPDVVILDLGLPDIDGLEVIRRLREWTAVPIIVLSARGQESDKIAALDAGADDYVSKPFGIGELLARMRAVLRHATRNPKEAANSTFVVGDLSVDLALRRVVVAEKEVHLTPIEYRLLTTLIHYAGKVVTQRQLLKEVWGPHQTEQPHYLRVYIAQLRCKLEADPARPRYLLTEPGVGYRLASE